MRGEQSYNGIGYTRKCVLTAFVSVEDSLSALFICVYMNISLKNRIYFIFICGRYKLTKK